MGEQPVSPRGWPQFGLDVVLDKMSSRFAVQGPLLCLLEVCVPAILGSAGEGRGRESIDDHALKTS